MDSFDVIREVEYAIRDIVLNTKTRYVMLRTRKLVAVNPRLEKMTIPKAGWALSYILREYERRGLIKIIHVKKGHVMKFFIHVEDGYFDYIKQLDQQLQAPAQTPASLIELTPSSQTHHS